MISLKGGANRFKVIRLAFTQIPCIRASFGNPRSEAGEVTTPQLCVAFHHRATGNDKDQRDQEIVRSPTSEGVYSESDYIKRLPTSAVKTLTMFTSLPSTHLNFQHDAKLHTLTTTVLAVCPVADLDEVDRGLYKQVNLDTDYVVITNATIFHPQGGGQPSDVGTMTSNPEANGSSSDNIVFEVAMARHAITSPSHVLHFGRFTSPSVFQPQQQVSQTIDSSKRLLYSRYHTAGHVLGAAVRHLLENQIEGFDELKASHFPDSASCEFKGLIDGKHKDGIQKKLDEYIDQKMEVAIDWWGREEFEAAGLSRLIPEGFKFEATDSNDENSGKLRVVKIIGAEVYPCGGTHVDTTDLCGKTTVRKISRQKGTSKVGYAVAA